MMRFTLLIIYIVSGSLLLAQQTVPEITDPDAAFQRAIQLTVEDKNDQAMQLCKSIAEAYPEYYDVVVFHAQLLGRESLYDEAHALIDPLLRQQPKLIEAHLTDSRLYYWKNNWQQLEMSTSRSLEIFPGQLELSYLHALALYQLNRYEEALVAAENIPDDEIYDERSKNLINNIISEADFTEVFVRYNFDHFSLPYNRNWHQLTTGVQYPLKKFKLIPYISAGHAIDPASNFIATSAIQFNLDAYIDISQSNYALLGYGFGSGSYLPKHRAIIHFWQTLPSGWGVSAGARYFYFIEPFLFYAVGVEKYLGNYWFELKSYLFRKDYGPSASAYLTARRYFENSDHYLGLTLGYGTSPDEPVTLLADLQRLNASSVRLSYQRRLGVRSVMGIGAGYMYEEYREQLFRHRLSGVVSFSFKIP